MIRRDGDKISVWQETSDHFSTENVVPENSHDVAIVGGGITGITLGLLLQQEGKKCIVLEMENIGFGTTGGTTAHINTLLDTPYNTMIKNFDEESANLVRKSAQEAIALIRDNVENLNIDCGFSEVSGYLFAQDEKQDKSLHEIVEGLKKVDLPVESAKDIPVPIPFTHAIRVNRQAQFHPLRYLDALAQAFVASGGVIVQHCRVTESKSENDIVHVTTSNGKLMAKHLVYATHIPPGINLLHLRCAPYRSYAIAVTLNDDAYPFDLAYDLYDPYHYYRTQEIDGKRYLIVGGEDHKTGHEANTEHCFTRLESHVRTYFNVKEVAYKWSSEFFDSTDGLPYIGKLPGASENILVATGYGGNGIVYSQVAAIVLRNKINGTEDERIRLFDPGRIKPVAGFTSFLQENLDVVKEFFAKRLSKEKLDSLAALAPGEGKVVKYENETIGLYKDEQGRLHAVNPTCTHMKCIVEFNNAEKSWDCPCHGGRFSVDGKVLTGPPSIDLTPINIEELIETQ